MRSGSNAAIRLDARPGPGVAPRPVTFLLAVLLLVPRLLLACDAVPAADSPFDGLCAVLSGACTRAPHVAVLSAFPAEQRVLRAATTVTERLVLDGRPVLVGRLAGQQVALMLTGIGLVNATTSTESLLAHLDVSAVVFSGVAGSTRRIGDVVVPATWTDVASGASSTADANLLAAASQVAAANPTLGRCTPVPPNPPGPEVCVPHQPNVTVGGEGQSSDPFGGKAFKCLPGGGAVFGCDPEALAVSAAEPIAVDEESAAVARVATARGIPFVVVRGVSDGAGDPLGLPGFPSQFFAYYQLAADNAATVVLQLLATLPAPAALSGPVRSGPGAACAFARTATPACAGVSESRRVERLVSRGCALRAEAASVTGLRADRMARKAAVRWRHAATVVRRNSYPSCCRGALLSRLLQAAAAAISHRRD